MEFISPESEVLARDGAEKITVNFARENPIHLSRFTKAVFNSADNDVLLFSPRVDAFNANERFTKLPLEDHSRESLRFFFYRDSPGNSFRCISHFLRNSPGKHEFPQFRDAAGKMSQSSALSINKNGVAELVKSFEFAGISKSFDDFCYEYDPRS